MLPALPHLPCQPLCKKVRLLGAGTLQRYLCIKSLSAQSNDVISQDEVVHFGCIRGFGAVRHRLIEEY